MQPEVLLCAEPVLGAEDTWVEQMGVFPHGVHSLDRGWDSYRTGWSQLQEKLLESTLRTLRREWLPIRCPGRLPGGDDTFDGPKKTIGMSSDKWEQKHIPYWKTIPRKSREKWNILLHAGKKKTCINRVEKLNRKWRRKSLDREGLDLGGLRAKAESWTFSWAVGSQGLALYKRWPWHTHQKS